MRPERGFSLLEYVLGLTILAIVLAGSALFFASQPRQLDPVFQFRAASLADALLEQILAVQYDGQNNPDMQQRCDISSGAESCTAEADFGTEQEADKGMITRFDDVDDFNDWCDEPMAGSALATELGLSNPALYQRFAVKVCVNYGADSTYKLVAMSILNQGGSALNLSLYRYNIR